MSAFQTPAEQQKRTDLASLMLMLNYAEAEARALGIDDAARHIAYAAMLIGVPQQPDWGLSLVETHGQA